MTAPRILLLDIETAPNVVHVWGLYDQTVGLNQIMATGYVMCWAAKWYGEKEVMFASVHDKSMDEMLAEIHALLDEADIVVHYNGTKFDIPTLNKEFVKAGMLPPSPYQEVDLLLKARRAFRFPSFKLDHIARELGVGQKVKHAGHDLWVQCMAGDEKAWATMTKYNKNDVVILERVYDRLMPWIKTHPNHGVWAGKPVCPTCGGTVISRGEYRSKTRVYRRFQCKGCGAWSRAAKADKDSGALLVGAA